MAKRLTRPKIPYPTNPKQGNKINKFSAKTNPLTYNEKFLKFSHHITYENILFIHKVKTGLLRCDLQLTKNFQVTNRTTRQSNNLRLPAFTNAKAKSSIFYIGIAEYNRFTTYLTSNRIKLDLTLGNFKIELKKFVSQTP